MTSIKHIVAAAALSIALSCTAQAQNGVKPAHAASLHAGSTHAVAYFLTEERGCKLVLTLADDANYEPTRIETAIEGGKSAQQQLSTGKSFDFACRGQGQTMDITPLETTAAN